MEASIPEIFIALENAVDHCINFTGVVEAKSLLRTLDHLSKLIVWNGSCSLAWKDIQLLKFTIFEANEGQMFSL